MTNLIYASQFKKDFKKIRKLPIDDLKAVFDIILKLENMQILDIANKDHALSGQWSNYRECHIKPDLLLIYKVIDGTLSLARLGSHSDLF